MTIHPFRRPQLTLRIDRGRERDAFPCHPRERQLRAALNTAAAVGNEALVEDLERLSEQGLAVEEC